MINILGWLLCGALVGLGAAWRHTSKGLAIPLFWAAGTFGALVGGVITLIFDTTPLSALSGIGLLGALGGAIALVAVAHRLSQIAA